MKFCVDNLPDDTTEPDIRQLFSGYGKVRSVTLLPGPLHSKQLGSATVELENNDDEGFFPNRCLFRGTIVRITREDSAPGDRVPGDPSAHSGTEVSPSGRPDNRCRNTLHVISVEEVVDPETGKSNGWCRYSIESLVGPITGMRQGSVAEVMLHAEASAEAFNQRNMLGKRPPVWSAGNKTKDVSRLSDKRDTPSNAQP